MKRLLLLLSFALFFITSGRAQVISARPNSAVKGQALTTTITLASGVMFDSSPPLNYQDIYLQQGATIIYASTSYDPFNSFNYYYDPTFQTLVWADSGIINFSIPANAPSGYYDVVMITYPNGMSPRTNTMTNGMLIREPAGTISGKVYFDVNQNGVFDTGDLPMSNRRVNFTPGNQTSFTNSSGDYVFYSDTGTYTGSVVLPPTFTQTSLPLSFTSTIPPSTTGNDFGLYSPSYLYNHECYISGARARCNMTSNLFINIGNTGVLEVQDRVTLITSSNFIYSSATVSPNTINGDTLSWIIPSIMPGTYEALGGVLMYTAPAAGQVVDITVIDSVFNTSGTFIDVYTQTLSYVVRCSYDPNDKYVNPEGVQAPHFTPINSELTYRINFQNTGNDYAYDVFIFDTLDSDLDLSTFEVVGSSHELNVQMTPAGAVRFNFFNIMLPDSGLNEAGSHGWVIYKIRPNAGLPDPTEITNTSYIVFDQNYPIITNTTLNTMTALQYPESDFSTADVSICETNCVIFDNLATSGTSYQWSFPGGSPSSSTAASPGAICYSTAGAYDVTLITTNALGSDTLTQIAYMNVASSPGIFSVVQAGGDSLIAPQGFFSYQWYYNNVPISGATSYYYVATQDGDYGIVVGNANGCQSGVNIPNVIIGVTELSDSNGFMIYPNPSDGQFKISYNSVTNETAVISIIDKIGQIVKSVEYKLTSGSNKIEMNTKELASGIYNIKIQIGSNVISKRLILNK